jgi:hypothetical protein
MSTKNETGLTRPASARDPFGLLKQMTAEFDRFF